jgi:hypothetical protein
MDTQTEETLDLIVKKQMLTDGVVINGKKYIPEPDPLDLRPGHFHGQIDYPETPVKVYKPTGNRPQGYLNDDLYADYAFSGWVGQHHTEMRATIRYRLIYDTKVHQYEWRLESVVSIEADKTNTGMDTKVAAVVAALFDTGHMETPHYELIHEHNRLTQRNIAQLEQDRDEALKRILPNPHIPNNSENF